MFCSKQAERVDRIQNQRSTGCCHWPFFVFRPYARLWAPYNKNDHATHQCLDISDAYLARRLFDNSVHTNNNSAPHDRRLAVPVPRMKPKSLPQNKTDLIPQTLRQQGSNGSRDARLGLIILYILLCVSSRITKYIAEAKDQM